MSFLAIAEELQLKGLKRQRNYKENFHDYEAIPQESNIKVPINEDCQQMILFAENKNT